MKYFSLRKQACILLASFLVFVSRFASADILCPTNYYIDVLEAPYWNLVVGPDASSGSGYTAYPSDVRSNLTSTKSQCTSSTPHDQIRIARAFTNVTFSNSADDGRKYFDYDWTDTDHCNGFEEFIGTCSELSEWYSVTDTQVSYRVKGNGTTTGGREVIVFDCADNSRDVNLEVSSGTWHSVNYRRKAVDVEISEVQSSRGQPRRFNVTCYYEYPKRVKVDFPRQTRADNRDISTNLNKTGFYRVYHMNNNLWRQVCTRDCNESIGHISSFSRTDGLGDWIQQCVNGCVAKGW